MKTAFSFFLLLAFSLGINAQTNNKLSELLVVSPSRFKLQATNVQFQGQVCSPINSQKNTYISNWVKPITVGNNNYYEALGLYIPSLSEGLVVENVVDNTCRIYQMSELAKFAGWFKKKERGDDIWDRTIGIAQVENSLWIGGDGVGVVVFDLDQKTWSRFDLKSSVTPRETTFVRYGDNDYVFVSRGEASSNSFQIYSVKHNKWLRLDSVSSTLVREYGFETGLVSVPTDHRMYAGLKYLPISPKYYGFFLGD